MTSSGPYTEATDMKQMFNFTDLRGSLPLKKTCPNSISGILNSHPDFKRFSYMMNLAQLTGLYDDSQADFTLFVPSDDSIKHIPEGAFVNMDQSTARHIIRTSTLRRRITGDLLEQSPAATFYTLDKPNNLWITNISGRTYVNSDVNVIHKDMPCSNGLIHVVDGLLWPNMSIGPNTD